MTTIIARKGLEYWSGRKPPPDLACVASDAEGRRVVTWADVMRGRRERQRLILGRKRRFLPWRAVKLWVAYFDQPLMGGWQTFVENWRGQAGRQWFERDAPVSLRERVLALFPLLLPFGTAHQRWAAWRPEFARRYERRRQDGRPVGVAYLWRRGDELSLAAPSAVREAIP